MKKHQEAKKPTLCWGCQRAIFGCEWARHFKPVPGWIAEKQTIYVQGSKPVASYCVKACPKFLPDEERPYKPLPGEDRMKPGRRKETQPDPIAANKEVAIYVVGLDEKQKKKMKKAKRAERPPIPTFEETVYEIQREYYVGATAAAREVMERRTKRQDLSLEQIRQNIQVRKDNGGPCGSMYVCGVWVFWQKYRNGRKVPGEPKAKRNAGYPRRIRNETEGIEFDSFSEAARWVMERRSDKKENTIVSYFSWADKNKDGFAYRYLGWEWRSIVEIE